MSKSMSSAMSIIIFVLFKMIPISMFLYLLFPFFVSAYFLSASVLFYIFVSLTFCLGHIFKDFFDGVSMENIFYFLTNYYSNS